VKINWMDGFPLVRLATETRIGTGKWSRGNAQFEILLHLTENFSSPFSL